MDVSRRRFLTFFTAALGLSAGGAAVARLLDDPDPAPPGTVAAPRPTPAEPAPTPTTTPAAPSTTQPPPATAAPTTTTTTSTTTSTTTTSTTTQPAAVLAIDVIPKSAWGAAAAGTNVVAHTIDRLTLHHTAAGLLDNSRAPARARQHQSFHMDAGWADLAYHFLVDRNGHIYEGRDVRFAGDTFTEYDPAGHFLVAAEGNFDEHEASAAQIAGVADLLAWAASHFGVDPSTLDGHRTYAATTCPGDLLWPIVAGGQLEAMVRERLATGPLALQMLESGVAADLVASIEAGTDALAGA